MPEDRNLDNRRSVRLHHFDYSKPGYYFVTICVRHHQCVFGKIVDGQMYLNDTGRIVQFLWERLPRRFPTVQLDAFILMPNHLHGIIELTAPPLIEKPVVNPRIPIRFQAHIQQLEANNRNARPVLGTIVRDFKGAASYEIHKDGKADFRWLQNYYESVIRDEKALATIREYIINNPTTWLKDKLYKSSDL